MGVFFWHNSIGLVFKNILPDFTLVLYATIFLYFSPSLHSALLKPVRQLFIATTKSFESSLDQCHCRATLFTFSFPVFLLFLFPFFIVFSFQFSCCFSFPFFLDPGSKQLFHQKIPLSFVARLSLPKLLLAFVEGLLLKCVLSFSSVNRQFGLQSAFLHLFCFVGV